MIKSLHISFGQSPSTDVVNYVLFIEKYPSLVTYSSTNFNIQKDTSVDLADYITEEGIYNIGIAAQDEVGNLSNIKFYDKISVYEVDDNYIVNHKNILIIIGIILFLFIAAAVYLIVR